MHAWSSAFGKPLLCLIMAPGGMRGFVFRDRLSRPELLQRLEVFPRGVVIGVAHAEQVSS
jgi:hypothetical protein